MNVDVLIVGGGLSGLSIADGLEAAGVDYLLVDSADRLGGRILSATLQDAAFDMGPAWFWHGQPRMAALVRRFGLQVFEQYSTGRIVFQDANGATHPDRGFSSMAGSLRIAGGMGALIDGLDRSLPDGKIRLGAAVRRIEQGAPNAGITIHLETTDGPDVVTTKTVVLALAPRIAACNIDFTPPLPTDARRVLENTPTWMAGQAKIIAVYDRPHWRDAGFSGDGSSQQGPMVEIHDASCTQGGPYALFGFIGVPPKQRAQHHDGIIQAAKAQLVAMFGADMADPLALRLQDWAQNTNIATMRDHTPPSFHPTYGLPTAIANLWGGKLIMASTETGVQFGGYLEGALEAAEAALSRLT